MANDNLLDLISLDGDVIPTEVIAKISRDCGNDIDFKCCHCVTPFQYEEGKRDSEKGDDTKYSASR